MAILASCGALSGCISATAKESPVLSAAGVYTVDAPTWNEVVRDPLYVHRGALLYSRDLAYRADRLRRHLNGDGYSKPDPAQVATMQRTVDMLEAPLRARPEVIKWRLEEKGGGLIWEPVEWQSIIKTRRTVKADLAIVGAELESVITACQAADAGMRVVMVYSGPLGGLCSDTGGNLRYFDGIHTIPRPPAQYALLSDGLGMHRDNLTALPRDVSPRLARYLRRRYSRRILLIRTPTLNTLHVNVAGKRLTDITTHEGTRIVASTYLDTDPEGRLAEKCGLGFAVDAPNLASGMVFDVDGLTAADWKRLRDPRCVDANRILLAGGITRDRVPAGSAADVCLRRLEKSRKSDRNRIYRNNSFGFAGLAEGYDLYQQARGLRLKNRELNQLNQLRCTSGFNISESGSTATFNSISYHFPTAVLQNDHDISREPRFKPFRRWEGPGLQSYFRLITGNRRLRVRLPRQFYVRRASALFATLHPYGSPDFSGPPQTRYWMRYPMDLRNTIPRDPYEERLVSLIWENPLVHGQMTWDCRASTTTCEIENLYLLNKSSIPARYYGGLRILQSLINTGTVLLHDLRHQRRQDIARARKKAIPTRTARR